ncbi:MAG: glycosyltransferase family 4 protein [Patescibacteria group bacterium]
MSKILIFSLAYHPFVGGAEVAIKEITERLAGEFEFEMITANLDGRQKEFEENFNGLSKIYRLGKRKSDKYFFPWLACRKAVELHRQSNYQMIWAMMANQAGWAALKFKKKFPQVPYLLTLQEGDSEWDIWRRTFLIRPIYKAIYKKADYIQAISNFLAQRAKNLGAKCPIEVVPNGISNVIASEAKQSHIFKNKDLKRVITVSRLVKKNGLEDLVKAMELVNKDYDKPVVLKIIGDGELKYKLEKAVNYSKIKDKIAFLGKINNEKVYEYLAQADIFVRPSLSEGLGNAFLEAMACGVPVIATPVGGIPDFLKDGETGWFCEVRNPKSIAEKIKYIFDEENKEEVDRVVKSAKKMVEENYNWEKISLDLKKIFNHLINQE